METPFQKKYRTDFKFRARVNAYSKANYRKKSPKERRAYANTLRERNKLEVLTHYGKHGKLQCCWRGCAVCDVDMLSLDHIFDDGAKHRKSMVGNRAAFTGKEIYQWVKSNGYPKGFQTLCMNHQTKKQRIKTRSERIDG